MDGNRNQTITVLMDTSPAERKARTFQSAELKRAREKQQAEAAAAKASAKAHSDAYASMVKDAKASANATAKIRADADNIQAQSAREAAKQIAVSNKEAAKESVQAAKDASRAAREAARDAAQAARDKARAEREAADDAKRATREREKSDRDYVRAKRQEANALATLAKEQAKGQDGVNSAIMGGVSAAGAFAVAMTGVSSAGQALSLVIERFQLMRTRALEESHKMTEEATDLRRLSALEGNLGAPSLTQASQLKLRAGLCKPLARRRR